VPTMATIQDREYVELDGKLLRPTLLGEQVNDYLVAHFAEPSPRPARSPTAYSPPRSALSMPSPTARMGRRGSSTSSEHAAPAVAGAVWLG